MYLSLKVIFGYHINILLPVWDFRCFVLFCFFLHEAGSSNSDDCVLGAVLGTLRDISNFHSPTREVTLLSSRG